MKIIGILCEYNPFHLGHKKQFDVIRSQFGSDCAIVCLMSGSFVQRGAPAIFDKSLRAQAAIDCGADLVLELPVPYALSSAEGFAAGAVRILGSFCTHLCFGTENGTFDTLLQTAQALLSPEFSAALRSQLESGCSFPAARQAALASMGADASLLQSPNDILAVEYCKAILDQGCAMAPMPIRRAGCYHDSSPDPENPSATALRRLLESGEDISPYVPEPLQERYRYASIHTLQAGVGPCLPDCAVWMRKDSQHSPMVPRACGENSCMPAAAVPQFRRFWKKPNPNATPVPVWTAC